MTNLIEIGKALAFLPILLIAFVIVRFYWKKAKSKRNAIKYKDYSNKSFAIPNNMGESSLYTTTTTTASDTQVNITNTQSKKKYPINYNAIQHLSKKYNIGTYRDEKGRYASLDNAKYE